MLRFSQIVYLVNYMNIINICAETVWHADLLPSNYSRAYSSAVWDDLTSGRLSPNPIYIFLQPYMITSLSLKTMEFKLDLNVVITWHDTRLNPKQLTYDLYQLPRDVNIQIWHPEFSFKNCKGCPQELIDPIKNDFNLQNQRLSVRYRSEYSFSCLFDLSRYPFDTQVCIIELELSELKKYVDFTYNNIEVDYTKKKEIIKELPTPPDFRLRSMQTKINCSSQPSWDSERFHCITYIFKLSRVRSQQVTVIFLPSALVVMLSWMGFWMNIELLASRMTLTLTCLLILVIQFNYAQRDLPSVSVTKAVDVWMFFCLFIVFAALIEMGLSFYGQQKIIRTKTASSRPQVRRFLVGRRPNESGFLHSLKQTQMNILLRSITAIRRLTQTLRIAVGKTSRLDNVSKWIFPLVFFFFNFIYWIYYSQ